MSSAAATTAASTNPAVDDGTLPLGDRDGVPEAAASVSVTKPRPCGCDVVEPLLREDTGDVGGPLPDVVGRDARPGVRLCHGIEPGDEGVQPIDAGPQGCPVRRAGVRRPARRRAARQRRPGRAVRCRRRRNRPARARSASTSLRCRSRARVCSSWAARCRSRSRTCTDASWAPSTRAAAATASASTVAWSVSPRTSVSVRDRHARPRARWRRRTGPVPPVGQRPRLRRWPRSWGVVRLRDGHDGVLGRTAHRARVPRVEGCAELTGEPAIRRSRSCCSVRTSACAAARASVTVCSASLTRRSTVAARREVGPDPLHAPDLERAASAPAARVAAARAASTTRARADGRSSSAASSSARRAVSRSPRAPASTIA